MASILAEVTLDALAEFLDAVYVFLAIGVGAMAQVVAVLFRMFGQEGERIWRPSIAGGVLAGLALMFVTGLLAG